MNQPLVNGDMRADEMPPEGYGAGHAEYQIRTHIRDLCRFIGRSEARAVVAEILAAELERRQ